MPRAAITRRGRARIVSQNTSPQCVHHEDNGISCGTLQGVASRIRFAHTSHLPRECLKKAPGSAGHRDRQFEHAPHSPSGSRTREDGSASVTRNRQ
eukprot:4014758-Prymnesium_polylepis.1